MILSMKKRINKLILLIIALSFLSSPLFACSIFSIDLDGSYYLAGNEDWRKSSNSVVFHKGDSSNYGYAVFGVTAFIGSYPQIALNEKGLSVDWATIPRSTFKFNDNLETFNKILIPELMRKCESVDDVVNYVKRYNISHFAEEHLIVADSSGKSVVLEWYIDGIRVIEKEKNYQLITNFNILDPKSGWYPCRRFSAGEKILDSGKGIHTSIDYISTILDAMHSEGGYSTLYSYIFDLKTRDIIIFNNHDYNKMAHLNLDEELGRGTMMIDLDDLEYKERS